MLHRYLILGLLMESPMSGYDIKKQVNAALATITNASYGTLYPTLHKLLAEGAVKVQEVPQTGRPSKKVYEITAIGRNEFMVWLKQPAAADNVRREFLLKLYLAGGLPGQDVLALLTARRSETESIQKALRAERDDIVSPQQLWVMDYALTLCSAEIEWLKQLERSVQKQVSFAPPEAVK